MKGMKIINNKHEALYGQNHSDKTCLPKIQYCPPLVRVKCHRLFIDEE